MCIESRWKKKNRIFSFLGSGSKGNWRRRSFCRIQGESVRPCVPPMAIWRQPLRDLEGMDIRTNVRTDEWTYRFPLYSTGLCLLRFPSEPLPCSHNSYRYQIQKQGKGTNDYLLPLGDWLSLVHHNQSFFLSSGNFGDQIFYVQKCCKKLILQDLGFQQIRQFGAD